MEWEKTKNNPLITYSPFLAFSFLFYILLRTRRDKTKNNPLTTTKERLNNKRNKQVQSPVPKKNK